MLLPRCPFSVLALSVALLAAPVAAQVNVVQTVAPNVYFHEGDIGRKGHCNNGWIIFADYVLVIDGNFPSGAREVIPKIKALTDKPIRFAFDTHHHGDHAYGNQVWHEAGAIPVAHVGVLDEFRRYETNYFGGGKPGRWEDAAKGRPDVAASRLKIPTVLFKQDLYFDDGTNRVELLHFGVAHTHGDGFAWLPKEKILFTGDACVNGPYNYPNRRVRNGEMQFCSINRGLGHDSISKPTCIGYRSARNPCKQGSGVRLRFLTRGFGQLRR